MKKTLLNSLALSFLLFSPALFAGGSSVGTGMDEASLKTSQATETVTQVGPNTFLRSITYHGSDMLAVGDPLGNSPINAKHDAGPGLTQQLPYSDPNCQHEACMRAFKRWHSPGTWQDDRAKGL